ncbi:hypothetical protein ACFO4E_18135 [Nocardiopsis mangrovi]|uniref:Uncharacterized protein n=1 Tax=Nocardiopsis mangrovi TaxID=1179818 RepID=A0ABV9E197_9ACTN
MEIRFELTGPDGDRDTASLYDWLRGDRALRRDVDVQAARRRALPGEMGVDIEAVLATVSTAAALAQLPFSYAAWRAGLRPTSETTIHVHTTTSVEIEVVQAAFPDVPVRPAESDPTAEGP